MHPTLAWLLDPEEPAVRAKALVQELGRAPDDPEVQAARAASLVRGGVARLLDGLGPLPADNATLYVPKYTAPFHRLIALAEMGAPGDEPRVADHFERLLSLRAREDGGFGARKGHLCVTGNVVRAAYLFGRGDDARVQRGIQWLVEHQLPNGAWTCYPEEDPEGTLDSWEALGAFAAIPARERTGSVRTAIARGVEYLLSEELGVHAGYEPWLRLHFPRHYYYDVLVGLDLATELGDPRDARLAIALERLRALRDGEGRWSLEEQHPDIGAGSDYTPHHPDELRPVRPLVVEEAGAPSRWLTLAAMRVLGRLEG
jgi:hypothetical protein